MRSSHIIFRTAEAQTLHIVQSICTKTMKEIPDGQEGCTAKIANGEREGSV